MNTGPSALAAFTIFYVIASIFIAIGITAAINGHYFKFRLTRCSKEDKDKLTLNDLCLVSIYIPVFIFMPFGVLWLIYVGYRMCLKHMKSLRDEILEEELKAFRKTADKKLKEAQKMVDYYNEEKFEKYNKLINDS